MQKYRNASVLAFMETWLGSHNNIHAFIFDCFGTVLRLDRDEQSTSKEHGDTVYFYINDILLHGHHL